MVAPQKQRKDFDALRAAYAYGELRLTQDQIGLMLGGLSQSRVSRLLKRAEERGWLERSVRFVPAGLRAGDLDRVRSSVRPTSLRDTLQEIRSRTGVRVGAVHLVESGSSATSPRAIDQRFARFGRNAADKVDALLDVSACVAVTWGRSVSCIVDGLGGAPTLRSTKRPIRVVPVCGEPMDKQSNRDTSSHLAQRLHKILSSTAPPPPLLTGIAALIPRHLPKADAQVIQRFNSLSPSYREVFGKAKPLIDQVNTLFTSVGTSTRPLGFVHEELLKSGGTKSKPLSADYLSTLVVGDIGGVLLPRPELQPRQRDEVSALNAMWTGVRLEHFERIAKAAARSSSPGVVVVSIGGEGRAEIVAEAVRMGLVNTLLIDRSAADALQKTLAG